MVAGVSGGLGRYFGLNAAFFRLGFVVLTLLGGAGILIYLAAVLVIPEEGKEQSIAAQVLTQRRERPWPLIGLGLAGVAIAVLLSRASLWHGAGAGWALVLLAGLALLWTYDARKGDRRARFLIRSLTAVAVLALAAAIAAVALAFAWFDLSLGDGVGDRVAAPSSIAALKSRYKLGVGDLRVDLSGIGPVRRTTRVHASVGIGALRVVVPRGTSVEVNARTKVGEVNALRRHDDGRNARVRSGSGGLLVVDAKVGAGRIDVVRAAP
jgi:phage shock protein PspC (stress-responsive transcriptional regulator)